MRKDIEFNAEGTTLRGWLYLPEGNQPFPTIVMANGFALVKEQGLDKFAEAFTNAGFACIAYDNRNLGASDGKPRQDIDPWMQMRDYRQAITYARSIPELDSERIGIWGTSYSGAHVLMAAAVDKRVKCVVAQVPGICGFTAARRLMSPQQLSELQQQLDKDRSQRQREASATIPFVSPDASKPSAFPEPRSYHYYTMFGDKPDGMASQRASNWRNEISLRSLEWWLEHDITQYMQRISPTPLLMILAAQDQISPTDLQLEAYNQANEPKKVVVIPGDHYGAYLENFERFSSEAISWYKKHL